LANTSFSKPCPLGETMSCPTVKMVLGEEDLNNNEADWVSKILVVGDVSVGKTSVISAYVHQKFETNTRPTIGVDFVSKQIQQGDKDITLTFWDISGQERFRGMTRVYYKGAVGAFVVCSMTDNKTLEKAPEWSSDIKAKLQEECENCNIPTILLVNKCDLPDETSSFDALDKFCRENNFVTWFKTSAKQNLGINEAVERMIKEIGDFKIQKPKSRRNATHSFRLTESKPHLKEKKQNSCCS